MAAAAGPLLRYLMDKLRRRADMLSVNVADEKQHIARILQQLVTVPRATEMELLSAATLTPGTPDYWYEVAMTLESVLERQPAGSSLALVPDRLIWRGKRSIGQHQFAKFEGEVFHAEFLQNNLPGAVAFLLRPIDEDRYMVIVDATHMRAPEKAVLDLHRLFANVPGARFAFLSKSRQSPSTGQERRISWQAWKLARQAIWSTEPTTNRINCDNLTRFMAGRPAMKLSTPEERQFRGIVMSAARGTDLGFEPRDVTDAVETRLGERDYRQVRLSDLGLFGYLGGAMVVGGPYIWEVAPSDEFLSKIPIPGRK